jgi:dihydroorotase (multifunctional complex type)
LPVDIALHNAKVYTSRGIIEAGIAIDDDRIVRVAKKPNLPKASCQINLKGNIALPGIIDSHVHLRDQELAYKEDFTSGTSAAAAGGITTVIDMPNNQPTTMSTETLQERMRLAEPKILVNVAFNSAFPTHPREIPEIAKIGAVGFKLYLPQQIGGINPDNDKALLEAFKAVRQTKAPIAVHAEDKTTIEQKQKRLMRQRRNELEAFLDAHSFDAEEKAIRRITQLSRKSGGHVHICHVSSKPGMNIVSKAKKLGFDVTCEVTPHHLLLTSKNLKKYGNTALEVPPLRKPSDVASLWRSLKKGSVDTIASDHAPHSLVEKNADSIWDAKPGIAGLETMLPLLLTQVNKGRLTIKRLVQLTCENPARIYRMKDRGSLKKGSIADITVINLRKEHRIDASSFYSKAKFSPFNGWKTKGKAVKTFVNGQLVMDDGEIQVKPGCGSIIRRQKPYHQVKSVADAS